MTDSAVLVAARIGAMLVLAALSGLSVAAESNATNVPSTTVMFVVSAPQKALANFTALQDEKVFKDSDCKKSPNKAYKRDFLRPLEWQKLKYGALLFIECGKPTGDTFQLFAQASLKASAESPGRTVKMLTDTITVSTPPPPCVIRYCGLDNAYHQAFPRPKTACSYCP